MLVTMACLRGNSAKIVSDNVEEWIQKTDRFEKGINVFERLSFPAERNSTGFSEGSDADDTVGHGSLDSA